MATHKQKERKQAASRRNFLKVAGAGTAAATFGVMTLSAKEARAQAFDAEFDVVVCGGGGAGLPVALFSRWLGNKVVVQRHGVKVGVHFVAGSVAFPKPQAIFGGNPLGRKSAAALRGTLTRIDSLRPNRAGKESVRARDRSQPRHRFERVGRLASNRLIVRDGILKT